MLGNVAPEFKFTDRNGKEQTYFPMTTATMLIFGDPSLPDWRLSRLRMESNAQLAQAVDKGKVNIIFIVPDNNDGWKSDVANYPSSWTVGIAPEVGKIYDFRVSPSIYVVGTDGKIIAKNASPESAVWELLNQVK